MTTIELSAKIFKARADNPAMAARIDKAARLVARHLADRAGRWIVAHIGPDGDIPHITSEVIIKYVTDMQMLGLL